MKMYRMILASCISTSFGRIVSPDEFYENDYVRLMAETGWTDVAKPHEGRKERSDGQSSLKTPSDDGAESMIRSKCADDWPSDFRMQKHCQDQQFEGLRELNARNIAGGFLPTIRAKCAEQWADDFRMRNYCEKQQVKALRELGF